ncbi:MAG: PilT/PilU family type 4a pilus ATPase [Sedimentisphaerales bacterium]|nr:PilT/PilU family type 4a pilus ATPase [Sedimentisphaerales bacterium]
MANKPTMDTPLYRAKDKRVLSMHDLLNYFSQYGSLRVSDLHLKVGLPPTYRVDGDLQRMKGDALDAKTVRLLVEALLSEKELQYLERDRSVDSSYISKDMQFRFNCFYDNDGLTIALRALDPTPIPIEEIGFPNRVWQDIVVKQWGLVLVTGITGAGKSTTIASLIDRIAKDRPCRIITLEDPIEYCLKSSSAVISQREVGRDVPDYSRGLRDCLREDPDVIFVGEMRDRESATWTLTAAETGHLVFSTLHTRDTRGTITRVLDMFPSNQQDEVASQLSLGLSHIICQKLVPRADGNGRVAAMEILNNTYATSNLIRLRKMEQVYTFLQTRTKDIPAERMISLERSLATLVQNGVVSAAEAINWANQPNIFQDELEKYESNRPGTSRAEKVNWDA